MSDRKNQKQTSEETSAVQSIDDEGLDAVVGGSGAESDVIMLRPPRPIFQHMPYSETMGEDSSNSTGKPKDGVTGNR